MTRADLITYFRELARDTVDGPYLWSSTLVTGYSELAEAEACSRKPLLTSNSNTTLCQIDVTADTATYAKHTAVRMVYSAHLESTTDSTDRLELYILDKDELLYEEPNWETLTGDPKYLLLQDASVVIIPTPTVDKTLMLDISYVPLTAEASFTIDSAHHYMLVFYMLYLAYSKSDADTKNPKRAAEYEAVFDSYFGPRLDANAIKSVRQVRPDRAESRWI